MKNKVIIKQTNKQIIIIIVIIINVIHNDTYKNNKYP